MCKVMIPGTKFEVRTGEPPEKIEMYAHSGECKYCKGVVKMRRDTTTGKLLPDQCWCLFCGQPYYVEIKGSLKEWEINQWKQKDLMA